MRDRHSRVSLIALLALMLPLWVGAQGITIQALFKDKAILVIDGARRVLKSGETSPEGVKLLSADTQEEKAVIEINGKRETLKLGVVVASFKATGRSSVTLYPERGGHFFADGVINGVPVRFLVDTGATVVAMNSQVANRLGLDYRKNGRPGVASTAGGLVRTYDLHLNTVQVGDVVLHNVAGSITEGTSPSEILLGMSFLGQLDMKRVGDKMELSER
jgi:aspartyl protease family protein